MRLNYPSDNRFNADNFADQPLIIIEQALEAIGKREIELGNLIATPISRAMLYILSSKGVKRPERELNSINPYAQAIESEIAKKKYSKEFTQVFLKLLKDGKIPQWLVGKLDIESITLAGD